MLDKNTIDQVNNLINKIFTFTEKEPIKKDFEEFLKKEIDEKIDTREKLLEVFQAYIFDHKIDNKNTPLDIFIEKAENIDDEERELLKGWKNSVHSVLRVDKRAKDAFYCYNIINEKEYVVRTLTNFLKYQSIGSNEYIFCRIVPVKDFHVIIGNMITFPMRSKKEMLEMAVMVLLENPMELFKDNPEKLKQVYEYNDIKYHKFYDLFGSDQIFTTGEKVDEVLKIFSEYAEFSVADKSKLNGLLSKPDKFYYDTEFEKLLEEQNNPASYLSNYTDCHDVGLMFNQKEGLSILPFYATFTEIFSNPNFKEIENYKECVMFYLENENISPEAFVKATTINTVNAVNVFEDVLEQSGFSYDEDIDKLLESYKYDFLYNDKVSQLVIYDQSKAFKELLSIYEEIAEEMVDFPEEMKNVGRNAPCPCGSGKKFKKCCLDKIYDL